MSDYIEVNWEVDYKSGGIRIDRGVLEECASREDMMDLIYEWIHEDAMQWIESVVVNSDQVEDFIDEVMEERKNNIDGE